jgi:hypothetical protein
MLIAKTNPVGIDAKVQEFQARLHTALLNVWGIDSEAYHCHERCYRNRKTEGYVAEVYTTDNEYKEVYWNDELTAISFFGLNNVPIRHDTVEQAKVHLVFFVNLAKLKPSVTHRADEEVRRDVLNIIGRSISGFVYESLELGIENVLKEYAASWRTAGKFANLDAVDMHPIHCFRLNFSINYDKNYCTTLKIK